jgi:hypothetical protein
MNISKEKKYEMKKQISLLSVFCTQAPSKNRCLKNATIHDNGFLITRLGLVEQHQNGVIANSSFKGGVIFNTITVKGTYYLQYYVDNSFLPRSLKLRKTRLFVMSKEWKPYIPLRLSGKLISLPFCSPAVKGTLDLQRESKKYVVRDSYGIKYPYHFDKSTGLSYMNVRGKNVPLIEGFFVNYEIKNLITTIESEAKVSENNFNEKYDELLKKSQKKIDLIFKFSEDSSEDDLPLTFK